MCHGLHVFCKLKGNFPIYFLLLLFILGGGIIMFCNTLYFYGALFHKIITSSMLSQQERMKFHCNVTQIYHQSALVSSHLITHLILNYLYLRNTWFIFPTQKECNQNKLKTKGKTRSCFKMSEHGVTLLKTLELLDILLALKKEKA